MAAHRFGRRRLARHLVADWVLALVLAATLLTVLALTGCGPGDDDEGAGVAQGGDVLAAGDSQALDELPR